MRRILASSIFLFSILLHTCVAQQQANPLQVVPTEVYGTVVDASTQEPIAYANVTLVGAFKSNTTTDPKGHYDIRTIDKADSIRFSYIGFTTRTVAIKRGKTQELNISLGSLDLKLTEVTVHAGKKRKHVIDTAANYVYYRVLEHKAENRSDGVASYRYDAYDKLQISLLNPSEKLINFFLLKPFKFVFKNSDTTEEGHVFIPGILKETIAEVYYRKKPKAIRRFVKADIISGIDNPSIGNLASYQFAEIDPYSNLFVIAGISFISPFSPRGIDEYYYYLTDTAKIDGRVSYKLHFVGKVKEDAALKGFAWVDSATWAVRSLSFRPNEKANFNFINDYTVRQDYTFVNNKYWIMNRETLNTVGSALKKKNAVSLLVTKVHTRRNIQADITFPDSIFKGLDETVLDDSARTHSYAWWDSARFETLTKQEHEVYHISDTIKTIRAWKTYEFFGRLLSVAWADAGPVSIGKILDFVSYNNVEGWRLRFGFETNQRFQHPGTPANTFFHKFFFSGYVAYGLGDRRLQYMALTRFILPKRNDHWQSLEAMYRYDLRVPGQDPDQTLITFDNVINLISGTVLTKILRTKEFRIVYEKEWFSGFSTIGAMNYKIFEDIPSVFPFTHYNQQVPNFGVTEFYIDTRYSYHDQYFTSGPYRYFIATRYPVFLLRYTASVSDVAGDYFHFQKLDFTIKQRLSSAAGHTSYALRAGKVFGLAPYTELYMTQGNLGYIYDKFNYDLLSEFEFINDQYVSLWVDHHFEGFLFNKIPGFNKLRLREIIFAKALIGTYNQRNGDILTLPTGLSQTAPLPYVEAGFGIENIIKMFRVDFTWRLTYRSLPGVPNWGVKFAFNPGF